jgi:hypothetical protein
MNISEENTKRILFNDLTATTARIGDLNDTIKELEEILQKLRRNMNELEMQKRDLIYRLKILQAK